MYGRNAEGVGKQQVISATDALILYAILFYNVYNVLNTILFFHITISSFRLNLFFYIIAKTRPTCKAFAIIIKTLAKPKATDL